MNNSKVIQNRVSESISTEWQIFINLQAEWQVKWKRVNWKLIDADQARWAEMSMVFWSIKRVDKLIKLTKIKTKS